MNIAYEAHYGAGYYFNLRPIRAGTYTANILHNTPAGWVVEEDVESALQAEHFKSGSVVVSKLATEHEIFLLFIADAIQRFGSEVVELIS